MQPALFIYPAQGIFIYFFESAFVLFGLFLKIFRALLHADGGGAVKCAAVIVGRLRLLFCASMALETAVALASAREAAILRLKRLKQTARKNLFITGRPLLTNKI